MLSQNLKARHRPKVRATVLSFTDREIALETTCACSHEYEGSWAWEA